MKTRRLICVPAIRVRTSCERFSRRPVIIQSVPTLHLGALSGGLKMCTARTQIPISQKIFCLAELCELSTELCGVQTACIDPICNLFESCLGSSRWCPVPINTYRQPLKLDEVSLPCTVITIQDTAPYSNRLQGNSMRSMDMTSRVDKVVAQQPWILKRGTERLYAHPFECRQMLKPL